jgi:hypothetical protein
LRRGRKGTKTQRALVVCWLRGNLKNPVEYNRE